MIRLREKLRVIDEGGKKRAHLRLNLAEATAEKVAGFPIPVTTRAVSSEPFRGGT